MAVVDRIRGLWLRLQSSLWFVPGLEVLVCMALALVLIELDSRADLDLAERFPRLFGAGTDGSRAMLSAIATSVITVAGVVFSITIVVLSQASSQYSPRVLRNFMRDRPTQVVLGAFVGIFAYALMVLRTVRAEGDDLAGFMPSFAVLGGLVLALLGVAMLIYFIHHVVASIQASAIAQRIADDTQAAIDRLFPEPLGQQASRNAPDALPPASQWQCVAARRSGYLVSVQEDALMDFARRHRCVVWLEPPVGGFVIEGRPLLRTLRAPPLQEDDHEALHALLRIDRQRDVHQDAPYGLQQLVDVGLKALSPSMNDPTTACECIDRLGALLVRLAGRHIPSPYRSDGDALRVIAPSTPFEPLVTLVFDPLAASAGGNAAVIERLQDALQRVGEATQDAQRREALLERASLVQQAIERQVALPALRERLSARHHRLVSMLQPPAADPSPPLPAH